MAKKSPDFGPKPEELNAEDLLLLSAKLRELADLVAGEAKKLAKVEGVAKLPLGNFRRSVDKLRYWATSHVVPAVSRAVATAKLG